MIRARTWISIAGGPMNLPTPVTSSRSTMVQLSFHAVHASGRRAPRLASGSRDVVARNLPSVTSADRVTGLSTGMFASARVGNWTWLRCREPYPCHCRGKNAQIPWPRRSPAAAVTRAKQRRICRATRQYIRHHNLDKSAVRFDIVAITWPEHERPLIEHQRGAFPWRSAIPPATPTIPHRR